MPHYTLQAIAGGNLLLAKVARRPVEKGTALTQVTSNNNLRRRYGLSYLRSKASLRKTNGYVQDAPFNDNLAGAITGLRMALSIYLPTYSLSASCSFSDLQILTMFFRKCIFFARNGLFFFLPGPIVFIMLSPARQQFKSNDHNGR